MQIMKKNDTPLKHLALFIGLFISFLNPTNAQFLSDTIDISHYRLDLDIRNFDAGVLYGSAELNMKSKMDNIDAFNLDLLKLTVDSAVYQRAQIDVTGNDTVIRVHLGQIAVAGEEFTIKIYYHGEPNVEPYGWGGFHFNSSIAYNLGVAFEDYPHNYGRVWYPCIDDFIDRATYDFYITADEDKMAVCTGHLIGVEDNGNGTKLWHWQTEYTLPTYLTSVAVSDYIAIESSFDGINGPLPMFLHVPSKDSLRAVNSFRNLGAIMQGYEAHWGAYPFDRVGFVSTPKGAMEHATNVAYPSGCIDGGLTYEYLYAHELSHMWFGDKVTCETAEDMWLNEGWAVFNEYLTQEILYGKQAYQQYYLDKKANVLQFAHINDGGYYALYGIPQTITYGETVYQKGALVVHTLRNYLGDEAFFPAVRSYLDAFAYNHASSWDLRDQLAENSGIDLNGFFDSWVFNPGFPQFSVDSVQIQSARESFEAKVFLKQKLKGTEQYFTNNRVMLRFMDNELHTQDALMLLDGEAGNQTFTLDFAPDFVLVNASDIMADAVTRDSKIIRSAGTYDFGHTFCTFEVEGLTDSAFVSVEHNWVAPDAMKEPLQGVRLSDYRYWNIQGNFDGKLNVTGKFKYSRTNYLDNTLLTNQSDSLMMLYRRDAADDWHSIEFNQFGPFNVGFIYVPNLKSGEYTLAVCEEVFVGMEEGFKEDGIQILPNPSTGNVRLMNLPAGTFQLIDEQGKTIRKGKSDGSAFDMNIEKSGFYLLQVQSNGSKKMITKKILISN